MSETISEATWYDAVGDVLTRLTLDARAAMVQAHDNTSRLKAFSLIHLNRDVIQMLADAVWEEPETVAKRTATYVVGRCDTTPEDFPVWLQIVCSGWKLRLAQASDSESAEEGSPIAAGH